MFEISGYNSRFRYSETMDVALDKKTKNALAWIVGILNRHNTPFQISGGFAAKLYGSPRPLNDIDLDIPRDGFDKIIEEVKAYIVYGPEQYKDKKWDVYLMTLNYHGQEIDVGEKDFSIHDSASDSWLKFTSDFSKTVPTEVD